MAKSYPCIDCQEKQEEIERLRFDLGQVQDQVQRVRHVLAAYEDHYESDRDRSQSKYARGKTSATFEQDYLLHKIAQILQEDM